MVTVTNYSPYRAIVHVQPGEKSRGLVLVADETPAFALPQHSQQHAHQMHTGDETGATGGKPPERDAGTDHTADHTTAAGIAVGNTVTGGISSFDLVR